jgi:hypothetical protein
MIPKELPGWPELLDYVTTDKMNAMTREELAEEMRLPIPLIDRILQGAEAAGYINTYYDDGKYRYYKMPKKLQPGTRQDLLWFIKRCKETTVNDILRFVMIDSDTWDTMKMELIEENMITKGDNGKWRLQ